MNSPDLKSLRSALFVPLADERFLAKAHQRGADALLLDLEDSVPPAQKDGARRRLPEAAQRLANTGATVMVRVNSDPAHPRRRPESRRASARRRRLPAEGGKRRGRRRRPASCSRTATASWWR